MKKKKKKKKRDYSSIHFTDKATFKLVRPKSQPQAFLHTSQHQVSGVHSGRRLRHNSDGKLFLFHSDLIFLEVYLKAVKFKFSMAEEEEGMLSELFSTGLEV
ncbi:hypothetical protein Pfo_020313 [Paulownia fortunei]|nr:hypothetical protein Pfo_020313 [Paulownia fortunei]